MMSDMFSGQPGGLYDTASALTAETQLVLQSLTAFTFGQHSQEPKTLSLVLEDSDVENRVFHDPSSLKAELVRHMPDIIFIDVATTSKDTIDALFAVS